MKNNSLLKGQFTERIENQHRLAGKSAIQSINKYAGKNN
jgi:hypothetical protein